MKKFFTFFAAALVSMTMMAETVTMDLALAKGSTPAPSIGEALMQGGAFDGTGYKMGSDGQFIGWNIAAAEQTFSAVTFNGYYNTNSVKNWGFQFSTDGGATWETEVTQEGSANKKEYHDIAVTVDIPEGANALRILRRAGTTAYVRSITLTLTDATPAPVEAAEISGKNAFALGGSVELTCTAAKATTYQWYLDGATIDGATAKRYTFTPSAAGEYSFTCSASNDYTATPVMADAFVVTVVDPSTACGELIKATHTGAKTATVTGVLGGTADKSTAADSKFGGKGQWFGITLASGAFQAGDELNVHTSKAAEQGSIAIYADKSGETMLYDTESLGAEGDNIIILPAALSDATSLYICRTETNSWNGYVDYIAVNRSCEASSNADLDKVWVMVGEEKMEFAPEEDGVTYNLVVPATQDIPEMSIYFSMVHPKATANIASPFVLAVPAAGAAANSQQIIVTAQDGTTTKTYTVNVSKSATASTDATLKSLAVTGYTLAPAFAADVFAYTITKAYGTENPGTDAVVCEPNDPTAHDQKQAEENTLVVTVTAEDGKTQLTYTINIAEAAAKKELLRAEFSNGVYGFIANGNIDVPYLAGEEEPTFVSVEFWQKDGEPTYEMADGKLVVTGVDNKKDEYTITYVALTPMEASYEEITFADVPTYIYSIYGWDADKGVKFSKDVEEATNHRISEGKDRIYIALPVAKEVILTGGSTGARPVVITVNGVKSDVASTPKKEETITIPLSATEGANLVAIESNGNNGDAGFTKIQLVEGVPTALENIKAEGKAVKVVINGQLYIKKGDKLFNALGTMLK